MNNTLSSKINMLYYLTLAAAIIETIGAIPVLGGLIIMLSVGAPLVALIVIYVMGLIFTIQAQVEPGADRYNIELQSIKNKFIAGIICAIVAFIPFIGWIIHIVMAVIMWLQYTSLLNMKDKIAKEGDIVADIKAEDVKSGDDK